MLNNMGYEVELFGARIPTGAYGKVLKYLGII